MQILTRYARQLSLVIMVVLTAQPLFAQGLERPLDATIDFSEHNFDFGYLPKGIQALHTYYIDNKGADTLRIIKVSAACGCTSTPLDKPNVAPGDTSSLDVFFSSKKFSGKVTKKISILSNDPMDPFTDIFFSATVDRKHPLIEVKPDVVEGGIKGPEKPGSTFEIELTNKSKETVGIAIISECEPYLDVKLSRDKIPAGQSAKLLVRFIEPHDSPKTPWYSVTLETDDSQKQRLTIPLFIPTT